MSKERECNTCGLVTKKRHRDQAACLTALKNALTLAMQANQQYAAQEQRWLPVMEAVWWLDERTCFLAIERNPDAPRRVLLTVPGAGEKGGHVITTGGDFVDAVKSAAVKLMNVKPKQVEKVKEEAKAK